MSDAEILLAHVLCKPREQTLAHPEITISPAQKGRLRAFLKKRSAGYPLAYLIHRKEFFGLEFYVDERVLIPRPETELLVEEVLCRISTTEAITICDVGTGSGCIAIALAKHLPKAKIIATDISREALEVAKFNAKKHGVQNQITFIKADILPSNDFDAVITNLPYISKKDKSALPREVLFEPREALFAGPTGLELLERLFSKLQKRKQKPKWVIAEIGFRQKAVIKKSIRKYFGNISVEFKNDLAGIPRMFYLGL